MTSNQSDRWCKVGYPHKEWLKGTLLLPSLLTTKLDDPDTLNPSPKKLPLELNSLASKKRRQVVLVHFCGCFSVV